MGDVPDFVLCSIDKASNYHSNYAPEIEQLIVIRRKQHIRHEKPYLRDFDPFRQYTLRIQNFIWLNGFLENSEIPERRPATGKNDFKFIYPIE